MDEIDLYVELVDEKEANDIFKHFKINLVGGNNELKKIKIRAILRGQLLGKKNKNQMANPFYQTYIRHKQSFFEGLTENEFLAALSENGLPDYVKLANLLIYYPKKFKDLSPLIEKNLNNGKAAFELNFSFPSEKEVANYVNKQSLLNRQESLLFMINKIVDKTISSGLLKIDEKNMEKMRNGTLIEWQKEYSKDNEEPSLWQYYYLKTHKNIDSAIVNSFCIDILISLLLIYSKKYKSESSEKIETKLTDYQNEINSLNNTIKNMDKERKEHDKKFKKSIMEFEDNIKQKEEEIGHLNTLLQYEKEKVKLKQIELENKITELEKENKQEKKQKENYQKRINEKEAYLKRTFMGDNEQNYIFGIISNMEINISKEIFGEVLFITCKNWKQKVKNLKFVCIQREGISTGQLTQIKHYLNQNNIRNKVITAQNEKDLIEQISRLKYEIGGGF